MEKLMFEFDEEKMPFLANELPREQINILIIRIKKSKDDESRPFLKQYYKGAIDGLMRALDFLSDEELKENLKMDFLLDEGPF